MFLRCPEHCDTEGTLSKYSRNIACRLDNIFEKAICSVFMHLWHGNCNNCFVQYFTK